MNVALRLDPVDRRYRSSTLSYSGGFLKVFWICDALLESIDNTIERDLIGGPKLNNQIDASAGRMWIDDEGYSFWDREFS